MAENMKINNVSPTKNCNVCRCLILGSEGIERCQRCIEVHGMTGIPIILTSKSNASIAPALKQLESIEWQRKRELLENPITRKSYDDFLTKSIHNIYGYDKSSIDRMTFEAREELAKIIYEAIQKSKFYVGKMILIMITIQILVSSAVFMLGLTNITGFIIENVAGSVISFFLLFGLYYGELKKGGKLDVACLFVPPNFEQEYEKFH